MKWRSENSAAALSCDFAERKGRMNYEESKNETCDSGAACHDNGI